MVMGKILPKRASVELVFPPLQNISMHFKGSLTQMMSLTMNSLKWLEF